MRPTNAFLQEAEALHSEGLRRCISCKAVKAETQFSVQTRARYGLAGRCKDCINEQNRTYYHANKDPVQVREKSLAQYYKDPIEVRRRKSWLSSIKSKYGLTVEQWTDLLCEQQGRCEICSEPMTGHKNVVVDHCHTTGKVRGLLCSQCNVGLGSFKDDPVRLAAAIDYLDP